MYTLYSRCHSDGLVLVFCPAKIHKYENMGQRCHYY